ncbi:MAG: hypothetical protein EPN86_00295 [Nanoarchaeota archaeon]|nr:MAG: hypothetical protein EPN86_00295 [Nanoarchaeota archaeon]
MSQKELVNKLIAYNAIVIGLAIYTVWLFRVRNVFALQASSLPVASSLLPPQSLYWIALVLMLVPFTLVKLPKHVRITSLVLVLFITIFSFPLLSPFGLPNGRDPQFGYQAAELIVESGYWDHTSGTGQAAGYADFPGLAIYHVLFSGLTGLNMINTVMWGIALLRFLLLPFLIFLIAKSLLKDEDLSLTALFVYFTNPSLTNHPHYEGMAIIFAFSAFYLLFISEVKQRNSTLILASLCSAILVITHHLTSYLFFLWFGFLIFFAVAINLLARIEISRKLIGLRMFLSQPNITKPVIFFIIFTAMLATWSLTIGESHFSYYTQDLESALLSRINPNVQPLLPENQNTPPAPITSAPPVIEPANYSKDPPLSFASSSTPAQEHAQNIPPNIKKPNLLLLKLQAIRDNAVQSVKRIIANLRAGNFSYLDIGIIGISIVALSLFTIAGLLIRLKYADFIEVASAVFFAGLMAAAVLIVVIGRFDITPRMFEFTYLGFFTFITAGLHRVLKKGGKFRQITFTVLLIMLFIAGNLLLRGGQQRAYYVADDKVTLDSSFMFLSPGAYAMTNWSKEHFEKKDVIGDAFIFDTIGAYSIANVHYYEPQLVRGIYRTSAITDQIRLRLKWDNALAIYTHKYLTKYGSSTGGPYTPNAAQKFDNYDWLDRAYDSATFQIYSIKEHP